MVRITLVTSLPENMALAWKETTAMCLERFGTVHILSLNSHRSGLAMVLEVNAPKGSLPSVGDVLDYYLEQFRDSRIISMKEN